MIYSFFIQGVENLPLSDTDGGNASLVFNAVNVIGGTYVDVETDFTLLGPESLTFQRLYSSADYATNELYKGWRHNQDSFIEMILASEGLTDSAEQKQFCSLPNNQSFPKILSQDIKQVAKLLNLGGLKMLRHP